MEDKNFCFQVNDSIFVDIRKMRNISLLFILLACTMTSCLPGRMFKTPRDFQFAQDTASNQRYTYLIQTDDKLELHIYSNDGFKLVDVTQTNSFGNQTDDKFYYLVEESGNVKLPVIGRVNLKGMSVKDAEDSLQIKYSKYYNDPFVVLRVTNRQALVFIGETGHGSIVTLTNDNESLYEVIAAAGGITEYSKAHSIKILRGDPRNPKVYKADISSIQALQNSELKVFSKDIIYVEGSTNISKRLSTEILPILGLFTSIFVIYTNVRK